MLWPFGLPYVERGLAEVLLLAVAGGLLGTWIVLRGLAFYAHAIGTATFPGLVVADGVGLAPPLGAAVAAALFGAGAAGAGTASRDEDASGTPTAIVLVACLAGGVLLASDVFGTGSSVETLLFGSLLLIGPSDIALAGASAALVAAGTLVLGRRWLAVGFDPRAARTLGAASPVPDLVLLALVGLTAVAALVAVGSLLATAVLVVPAATVRLVVDRLGPWQLWSIALAGAEGVLGLWLAVQVNAPPGATIAVVGGLGFAATLAWRALRSLARPRAGSLAAGLALLALVGTGCGGSGGDERRLVVVATTTQLGDLVANVGGAAVDLHQILRPSTDPHAYEPRPADVQASAGARVVVRSGMGLDRWMAKVVEDSASGARILDLGLTVPVRRRADPHWWQDPVNAEVAVRAIQRALSAADPAHARGYARRADAYERRLASLRARIAACLRRVPPSERELVTDHDALGYFAARFGIRVVGAVLPAQTTQAQASARALVQLAAVVRREHVRAIFPETSLNASLVLALARQTGARSDLELYGDTLGAPGTPGSTYLGMLAHNADAMADGFTGGAVRCRPA